MEVAIQITGKKVAKVLGAACVATDEVLAADRRSTGLPVKYKM